MRSAIRNSEWLFKRLLHAADLAYHHRRRNVPAAPFQFLSRSPRRADPGDLLRRRQVGDSVGCSKNVHGDYSDSWNKRERMSHLPLWNHCASPFEKREITNWSDTHETFLSPLRGIDSGCRHDRVREDGRSEEADDCYHARRRDHHDRDQDGRAVWRESAPC